jgi:hypothetical protein
MLGANASIAMAVIGPMPGIDISRAALSERLASNLSVFSCGFRLIRPLVPI